MLCLSKVKGLLKVRDLGMFPEFITETTRRPDMSETGRHVVSVELTIPCMGKVQEEDQI